MFTAAAYAIALIVAIIMLGCAAMAVLAGALLTADPDGGDLHIGQRPFGGGLALLGLYGFVSTLLLILYLAPVA